MPNIQASYAFLSLFYSYFRKALQAYESINYVWNATKRSSWIAHMVSAKNVCQSRYRGNSCVITAIPRLEQPQHHIQRLSQITHYMDLYELHLTFILKKKMLTLPSSSAKKVNEWYSMGAMLQ